jgi:hypothetical protein
MRDTDHRLAEAIDQAMWPALMDAAHEALQDAIAGNELPAHPDVLKHAICNATDMLGTAWADFGDAACGTIAGNGTLHGASLEELRTLTHGLTRAVDVLLAHALGEDDD